MHAIAGTHVHTYTDGFVETPLETYTLFDMRGPSVYVLLSLVNKETALVCDRAKE